MLVRDSTPVSSQEFFDDQVLNQPTTSQSVYNNLAMSYASPVFGAALLSKQFAQSPTGQMIRGARDALNYQNEQSSDGQAAANDVASILGFALNPITIAAGGVGGELGGAAVDALPSVLGDGLGDAATTLLNKPLSNFVSSDVAKSYLKDATVGSTASKSLEAFGVGAGSSIPSSIFNNYNFDTNHVDWGGVATDASVMGGMALGISALPFAYGMLKGKVNVGVEPNAAIDQPQIDAALKDGRINQEEHSWLTDYHELKNNPDDTAGMADIQSRASKIINDNGIYTNSVTNETPFNILKPEDMDSLKSAASDQLTSDLPDNMRSNLTDFIAQNSLDNLRDNPKVLDGVRGYVDHINEKLAAKGDKLAQSDGILDTHLTRGVNENLPFSQKEIMKMMKKSNFDTSHTEHFPLTIPENVKTNFDNTQRVSQLEKENKSLANKNLKARNPKYTDKISDNVKRIKTLSANARDYVSRQNNTPEAKAQVKDWEDRIESLKAENKSLQEKDKLITSGKRYLDKIEKNNQTIKEINDSNKKVLTPKEELNELREKLTNGNAPDRLQSSQDYQRLTELARVWKNAQSLLDRVHEEAQYKKQEAFKNLCAEILKLNDSNVQRLADPSKVSEYLNERLQSKILRTEEPAPMKEQIEQLRKTQPEESDMQQQKARVDTVKAGDLNKEFNEANAKLDEFKGAKKIFNDLMSCIMGGASG